MTSPCSPIAYFAFNRPEHTARTLAALAANAEAVDTDLFVFVDGARNDPERTIVAEVVRIARSATGFRSITVSVSDANRGLFRAITSGVDRVVSAHGRAIVVEDDIFVSPDFLAYMNDGLRTYEFDPRVGSIHGYSPPIAGLPTYYFLRGGDCWGWATWRDRWDLLVTDARLLLKKLADDGRVDDFCGTYGYQSLRMMANRAMGKNNSWAILWHASLFLQDRLTLHPSPGFVRNIGVDGSGTHSQKEVHYDSKLAESYGGLPEHLEITQSADAARLMSGFLDGVPKPGPIAFMKRALLKLQTRVLVKWAGA
jgi:hypothetical protein